MRVVDIEQGAGLGGREMTRLPIPALYIVRERKASEVGSDEEKVGGGKRVISVEVEHSVSVSPDQDVGLPILAKVY